MALDRRKTRREQRQTIRGRLRQCRNDDSASRSSLDVDLSAPMRSAPEPNQRWQVDVKLLGVSVANSTAPQPVN
jgi:hypothetical protein